MINSVAFRNFKSLRAVELELERFTVLVGPNASGKTSVLEGLHYLSQLGATDPKELFTGNQDPLFLYSRGANGDMELMSKGTEGAVSLRVKPPLFFPEDLLHPSPSSDIGNLWQFTAKGKPTAETEDGWKPLDEVLRAAHAVPSAVLLRLNASRLADATYSRAARPRVAVDGQGLASALAYMALNQPDEFQELQRSLRTVIPAVNRIRFDRVLAPYAETE